ncbi:MAG: FtsX-like permease family protein [Bacteroidia bacterium]
MILFTLAWRNLWRNKRRTLITAASVFFAVLLAIVMRSFQEGTYEKMIENVVSFYSGYAQIHKTGYWDDQSLDNSFEVNPAFTQTLENQPLVADAVPRLESFALASSGEISEGCLLIGTDPGPEDALTHLSGMITRGRYFEPGAQGVMVAEGLSEKLHLGVNDTLVLISQGYQGVTSAGKYVITGLVKFGSPELNDRMVYLPLPEARKFYGAPDRVTSFALSIDDPHQVPQLLQSLKTSFTSEEYEVMGWKDLMPELVQLIEADRAGGILMMAILYTIIGFGMFGTVLMMTAERQYEMGVMTAIGMKKSRLAAIITIETIMISMIGVVAGAIGSLPVVVYFHQNPIYLGDKMAEAYAEFGMEAVFPMAISPQIFFSQALVVFIFAWLVSIYPAWKIMHLNPIKAMHS